ncbi:MAG TPA: SHOCT domain-containing protein [Gaiellaceae bacterium]|nr:SHOCT domain-containing protein [Gaiellaceae bacterium]
MLVGAYTFWDGIWTMIVFFAWIMVIAWVIMLLIDNFRRTDHSGLAKAGWAVFLIFLPVIGAITYTIARPQMEEAAWGIEQGPAAPAGAGDGQTVAAEIARLSELRAQGAITDAEYDELKKKAIATA